MKIENFEEIVKMFVSSVKRIEYVEKYDFYCIIVSGSVCMFELNRLSTVCHVSHISCSETGCVEIICKCKDK